jgi:hypothetical protein
MIEERVRLALSLPVALLQGGDGADLDGTALSSTNDTSLGDLRLGMDIRLLGQYGQPFRAAAGLQWHIPTGSQEAYTSDGAARLTPRVMLAGDIDPFLYAVQVGITYRGNDAAYAGATRGSELNVAAAAGLRLMDGKMVIGPELFGSTVFSDSDAWLARRSTPLELIFGGHGELAKNVRFGIGIGPGLSRSNGFSRSRPR